MRSVLGLLALLLLIGIVAAFLIARDSSDGDGTGTADDDGHGTLRRVFVYSLVLLGAVLTASGLSGILRVVLEGLGGTTLVSESDRGLALGLSLTVVGLPVWLLAWRAAQRDAGTSPAERRSSGRRMYLAAVRLISLGVAVPYAVQTGLWLVGEDPYGAEALSRTVVWGLVWAYHERLAREVPFGGEGTHRVDRVEVYLAAAAGFALLATSVGGLLALSLEAIYESWVGVASLVGGAIGPDLRTAAVGAVVGGALWGWHWTGVARRDAGSTAWLLHLFLVGVLSGTATVVVSGSVLLHSLLAWALGAAEVSAAGHFDVVPSAVAGLLVGAAVWGYHRAVLREVADVDRLDVDRARGWSGPERIYRYLMTAAGMLTSAGGIVTIVMVGLDLAVPGRTVVSAGGGPRDVVAVGLTLLLIGVPLWAWSWTAVQRRARTEPSERNTLARRVLIFGAFGIAIVTTVVASSVLLFELFDAVLAGELTTRLIEERRWSIALLLTAGAVSVHYGLVLREDRARAPTEETRVRLRQVVLVAPRAHEVAEILRGQLDAEVTAWDRRDVGGGEPAAVDIDGALGSLSRLSVPRALVVVEEDGTFRAIPLSG